MASRSPGRAGGRGVRADPFDWSGGHPALDFVNTVDERPSDAPIETLRAYRDLVRFAELAELIAPSLATALRKRSGARCVRITRRARELREHLYHVLAATLAGRPVRRRDLDAIGGAIRSAHAGRVLVMAPPPHVSVRRWLRPTAPETPLHACALAIERLLVEVDRDRIRKCDAPDCDVYFLDTSKGQRRQWCRMSNCGNREKQRRWRSAK